VVFYNTNGAIDTNSDLNLFNPFRTKYTNMASPYREPDSIKKVKGTYRDKQNNMMDNNISNPINPPPHLSKEEKQYFINFCSVASEHKFLIALDVTLIELYVCSYVRWRKCNEELKKQELVIKSRSGYSQRNTLYTIIKEEEKTMMSISDRFGLSPAARTKIHLLQTNSEPDAFDKLLLKRKSKR
jgi:P27 family predicted phage terminase small subunit